MTSGSMQIGERAWRPNGARIAMTLAQRELVRFVRQPVRIAAAVGTPIMVWLILASGLSRSMAPGDAGEASYSSFLLPGMMTLAVMFAAVFSSISIIEDRREGWLQSVLVSPAPRWSIALGKTLGGAAVAWLQAALLLLAIPFLHLHPATSAIPLMLLALAVTSVAMTAVGLAFAWRCRTSASFHAVMNLVFLPAWVLSGALFPLEAASGWLRALAIINPLGWCTSAIRSPLTGEPWLAPMTLAALFAVTAVAAAAIVVARASKRLR